MPTKVEDDPRFSPEEGLPIVVEKFQFLKVRDPIKQYTSRLSLVHIKHDVTSPK